jgi:hypothetical protein
MCRLWMITDVRNVVCFEEVSCQGPRNARDGRPKSHDKQMAFSYSILGTICPSTRYCESFSRLLG